MGRGVEEKRGGEMGARKWEYFWGMLLISQVEDLLINPDVI